MRSLARLAACLSLAAALAACSPVEPPQVDASALPDTTDTQGPYPVSAQVRARRSIGLVELVWHNAAVSPGGAVRVQMLEDANVPGLYAAAIPGLGAGAVVDWHVEAKDSSGDVGAAPPGAESSGSAEYTFRVLASP